MGGALDASARNVHAADSLSRDVAGKMSLEEQAILNNLDNLPDPADRSKLVRNLENIIHRTETDGWRRGRAGIIGGSGQGTVGGVTRLVMLW